MNRLGLLVDLSHVAKKTMLDTLNITQSPIIFSHSSAWTLCKHTRNVQDDVLQLVVSFFDRKKNICFFIFEKINRGVVMVAFTPAFITCNTSYLGTIPDVAGKNNSFFLFLFLIKNLFLLNLAHINHIRNIAGIDSVGIGADFDGIEEYVLIFISFIYIYIYIF